MEQTICVRVTKDFGNCIHTKIKKQNLRHRNQWIKIRRKKDQKIWVNYLINLILIKVEYLKRMVLLGGGARKFHSQGLFHWTPQLML